jgi:hypothetical protein
LLALTTQARHLAERRAATDLVLKGLHVPYTGLIDISLAIVGVIVALALLVAVLRAKQEDLPEIVRG